MSIAFCNSITLTTIMVLNVWSCIEVSFSFRYQMQFGERNIYVLPASSSGLYWKYCLEMVVVHSKSQSTVQSMSPLQSSPESSAAKG